MRRNSNSFNLSFIDIISCGLGAVVLLLILIKDSPFFNEKEIIESIIVETDNSKLEESLSNLKADNDELVELISTSKITLNDLDKQISDDLINKTELQKEISNLIVSDDAEEKKNFVSSCKLDRDKTLVLLDSSASMLAYNFVDVLTAKSSSKAVKEKSDKFGTAKKILEWLINQAEDDVRLDVATFSNKATLLSEGLKNKKDILGSSDFLKKVGDILPNGETNLYQALKKSADITDLNVKGISGSVGSEFDTKYIMING